MCQTKITFSIGEGDTPFEVPYILKSVVINKTLQISSFYKSTEINNKDFKNIVGKTGESAMRGKFY